MNATDIGIKVADGTFYSVLEEDFKGQKKLTVTTVRDNQDTVQIDLFKGHSEDKVAQDNYIGSLIIENIQQAPKGEPEIEVFIGLDEKGNLDATANDLFTGERQSLSVSLESLSETGLYEVPEFDIEDKDDSQDLEETLLTGESYPIGPTDRRKEHLTKKKRNPLLLIGFVLLGLIVIAGLAFLVYRGLNGPLIPSLLGGRVTPRTEAEAPAAEQEAQPAVEEKPAAPAVSSQEETASPAGVSYLIKRGDTLWDISSTYYRNPWLYPKIARANSIADPDIIFAGQTIFIPEN